MYIFGPRPRTEILQSPGTTRCNENVPSAAGVPEIPPPSNAWINGPPPDAEPSEIENVRKGLSAWFGLFGALTGAPSSRTRPGMVTPGVIVTTTLSISDP